MDTFFLVPLPPYNILISKFVNPVLTEYLVGGNRTMLFPVYGAVVMWGGPDSGYFDGFHIQLTPPDGIVRLPITLGRKWKKRGFQTVCKKLKQKDLKIGFKLSFKTFISAMLQRSYSSKHLFIKFQAIKYL